MNQAETNMVPSGESATAGGNHLPFPPSPMSALPTLPRNALRKILERSTFTPEDVAELGYRRLEKADGIGRKSLDVILAWLRNYGHELQPPPAPPLFSATQRSQKKAIDFALRILRANGYTVCHPGGQLSSNSADSPESD